MVTRGGQVEVVRQRDGLRVRQVAARRDGEGGEPAPHHAAFRASAAMCTKVQNASGWTAQARKAAAMASRSERDAYPYSTARSPIGEVSRRAAYDSPQS